MHTVERHHAKKFPMNPKSCLVNPFLTTKLFMLLRMGPQSQWKIELFQVNLLSTSTMMAYVARLSEVSEKLKKYFKKLNALLPMLM